VSPGYSNAPKSDAGNIPASGGRTLPQGLTASKPESQAVSCGAAVTNT
jgi:hypothetical protein